ncbi:MAG: DUF2971 domain-containing protein [Cyclobacteriaceae bacterium]
MTLYHYTSGQGIFGIFNSSELHCSNVNFLNDPSEQSYFSDLLNDVFNQSSEAQEIHKALFNESFINAVVAPFDIYIGSFSKNGDSLSMWNYYSKGNGYNLGVDIDEIIRECQKDKNVSIQKIELIYEKSKQIDEIREFLLSSKDSYSKYSQIKDKQSSAGIKEEQYYELESDIVGVIEEFNDELYKLMLRYKHQAYDREEEVRLIVSENEVEQKTTKFKVSDSGVFIEYIPLKLDLRNSIKSVTIHPLNGQLHVQGVKGFIRSRAGYNNKIEIKSSSIPFRVV